MDAYADELVEHCQHRLGNQLRGVFMYEPGEPRVLYTRDDVGYGYTHGRLQFLLNQVSKIHESLRDMQTDKELLGAPEASIQVFEHALVIVVIGARYGVAISVDREITQVTQVVDGCVNVLESEI